MKPMISSPVFGEPGKTVIYKSESHKLHQAFPVKKGDTIVQGQPVMLNNDGTISPLKGDNKINLGIAITDTLTPAYGNEPIEATVMVKGFAIVYGVASSSSAITPGYVKPVDVNAEGYTTYETSDSNVGFIALNSTSKEGDLMQILIQ